MRACWGAAVAVGAKQRFTDDHVSIDTHQRRVQREGESVSALFNPTITLISLLDNSAPTTSVLYPLGCVTCSVNVRRLGARFGSTEDRAGSSV